MEKDYSLLEHKIEAFIRKFYMNRIIKGSLLSLSFIALYYLLINLLEYNYYFNSTIRTVLFFVFLSSIIAFFIFSIIIPLTKILKIGNRITYDDSAKIIGKYFPEIKDKLLNVIQLNKINNLNELDLLNASIQQKAKTLKMFSFKKAVDYRRNKKYLRYFAPPIIFLIIIIIVAPGMIKEPSKRLISYGQEFEKPQPYYFIVKNNDLNAIQNSDFNLKIEIKGDRIPDKIFIESNNIQYLMTKNSTIEFNYIFKNVQKNIDFNIVSAEVKSKNFRLSIMPQPMILNFSLSVKYPSYLKRESEVFENTADVIIPEGSKLIWEIKTRDVETLSMRLNDSIYHISSENQIFNYSKIGNENSFYSLYASNDYVKKSDSIQGLIQVIPDAFPEINVENIQDSVFNSTYYFRGAFKDDYGFTSLQFCYKNSNDNELKKISIPIDKRLIQQEFYYYFDFNQLEIENGNIIDFYFEITDNDAVNGFKTKRSTLGIYKKPSKQELNKSLDENNKNIKNSLQNAIQEAQNIQKEIEKLNNELLNKKKISWEDKQKIKDILEQQKELEKKINELKKENNKNNQIEDQYKKIDPELLEKQKKLNELFNELLNDEMKKMMEDLQKMMQKQNKDQIKKQLEKIQLNNEDLEKELDRNMELFKQLEFDKKLNEKIDDLKKLAEEQKKLSEQTKNKDLSNKDLQEKQIKIEKEFEDIKKELEQLDKLNKELEEPNNFKHDKTKENQIKEDINNSKSSLEKKKNSSASKSQKQASQKMEEMAEDLQKMADEMEAESNSEDYETLREILQNLIQLSHDQENIMNEFAKTSSNDPQYVKLIEKQKTLKDAMQMTEDSLFALSKRQLQIQSFVNQEINKINHHLEKVFDGLLQLNTIGIVSKNVRPNVAKDQQYVMTSVNNLALMLSESLDQMKKQMQQSNSKKKKGKKKCNNPKPGKSGKPSAKTMKQLQEQLNKQMKALKKQMEEGKGKGKSKQGNGNVSKELAKLAAQQEAIRKMMQEYREDMIKNGAGDKGETAKMLQQMEQTEKDLVNKVLNEQTIRRQESILTRLLESEKADREREFEKKREAEHAKTEKKSNPKDFFKYKEFRNKEEEEVIYQIPAEFKPFYKKKINEYFYNFEF